MLATVVVYVVGTGVVVVDNDVGVVKLGALGGCGAEIGALTSSATVEAGTGTPNSRKSCSACARVARTFASALSLPALVDSAASLPLASLSALSPLRIVDSSLAFSIAKRLRSAFSSATS